MQLEHTVLVVLVQAPLRYDPDEHDALVRQFMQLGVELVVQTPLK